MLLSTGIPHRPGLYVELRSHFLHTHPQGAKGACEEALCWLREQLLYTAATLLLGRGINPKIVSEMLGHSQIGITLGLYGHVTPHMQQQAANAMDAALNRYRSSTKWRV